jgi:hypothetical protein
VKIGNIAEHVNDLERRTFLTGDSMWIDRVHNRKTFLLTEVAHDP